MPALVGQPFLRREDRPLLVGQGQYAGDFRRPGLLHMAVVRSVYPHARVRSVSLDAAHHLPGVVGAFSLQDLPELHGPLNDPTPPGVEGRPRPVLAGDKVRYVGEPIAVVLAEDPAVAVDAAQAVEVDYEPLDGLGNVQAATATGAPLLHDGVEANVAGRTQRGFGDIEAAFSS